MPRLSEIRRAPDQPGTARRASWVPPAAASAFVLLSGYLGMLGAIALVLSTAEGAGFSFGTVLVPALAGWLAAYQVPLSIGGAALTPLPLAPTLLIMLLIAATSARAVRISGARRRRGRRPAVDEGRSVVDREYPVVDRAYSVVLSMALTHAVVGGCIALLLGCASVVDAPVYCAAAATLASTAGVARPCGLLDWVRESAFADVWSGLRSGLLGLAALVAAGLLVLGVGLFAALPRLGAVLGADPLGDALGKSLLSIAYLPNAALAGWSFAAGTGFSLGQFALRPLELSPAPVPELPLFAVLPEHGPQPWWAAVYLLPLAVGALVGWRCRHAHAMPLRRIGVVGAASAVVAAGSLLLAGLAGGRLGGGAFDPMTLRPGPLAAATFCWIGLPAAAVAWFAGPDPRDLDDPDAWWEEGVPADTSSTGISSDGTGSDEDVRPDGAMWSDGDGSEVDEWQEADWTDVDWSDEDPPYEDVLADDDLRREGDAGREGEPPEGGSPSRQLPEARAELSARTVEEIDDIELDSRNERFG